MITNKYITRPINIERLMGLAISWNSRGPFLLTFRDDTSRYTSCAFNLTNRKADNKKEGTLILSITGKDLRFWWKE